MIRFIASGQPRVTRPHATEISCSGAASVAPSSLPVTPRSSRNGSFRPHLLASLATMKTTLAYKPRPHRGANETASRNATNLANWWVCMNKLYCVLWWWWNVTNSETPLDFSRKVSESCGWIIIGLFWNGIFFKYYLLLCTTVPCRPILWWKAYASHLPIPLLHLGGDGVTCSILNNLSPYVP